MLVWAVRTAISTERMKTAQETQPGGIVAEIAEMGFHQEIFEVHSRRPARSSGGGGSISDSFSGMPTPKISEPMGTL